MQQEADHPDDDQSDHSADHGEGVAPARLLQEAVGDHGHRGEDAHQCWQPHPPVLKVEAPVIQHAAEQRRQDAQPDPEAILPGLAEGHAPAKQPRHDHPPAVRRIFDRGGDHAQHAHQGERQRAEDGRREHQQRQGDIRRARPAGRDGPRDVKVRAQQPDDDAGSQHGERQQDRRRAAAQGDPPGQQQDQPCRRAEHDRDHLIRADRAVHGVRQVNVQAQEGQVEGHHEHHDLPPRDRQPPPGQHDPCLSDLPVVVQDHGLVPACRQGRAPHQPGARAPALLAGLVRPAP